MDGQHSLRNSFLGSTPHPSSPISAAATSSSPRLHAIGRRFRSPPAGASTLVLPTEHVSVQSRNAEAVKSAKKFLLSTVRSDWEYDPESPPSKSELSQARLEDVEYRRREDGSSDPGSGPEDMRDPMAWTDGELDPYRYESPDAVAAALLQKKRKRRRLLKEEMQHNEGLRVFHARRNAWTGAVKEKPKRRSGAQCEPIEGDKRHNRHNSLNLTFDFELTMSADRSRSSSPASAASPPSVTSDSPDSAPEPSEQHPVHPTPDVDVDPLLPISPPLIPRTNPVRSAITPSMYPTIYSKVVLQSLTPSVPIPLPDMTRAMVQGWKEEGNWPPKSPGNGPLVNEGVNGIHHNIRKDPSPASSRSTNPPNHATTKEKDKKDHNGSGSVRKGMSGAFRKALGSWRAGNHGSSTPGAAQNALIAGGGLKPRAAALGDGPVGAGSSTASFAATGPGGYADPGNAPDTEDADVMFEGQ